MLGPYLSPAFYESARGGKSTPVDQGDNLLVIVNLDDWPVRLSVFLGKVKRDGPGVDHLVDQALKQWADLDVWQDYDHGDDPPPPGAVIKTIAVDDIRQPIQGRLRDGYFYVRNPYLFR